MQAGFSQDIVHSEILRGQSIAVGGDASAIVNAVRGGGEPPPVETFRRITSSGDVRVTSTGDTRVYLIP